MVYWIYIMTDKAIIYMTGMIKLILIVAFSIGWAMNLAITFGPNLSGRELACRIGGVFIFPAGGIMGYMEPNNPSLNKKTK